MSEMVLITIIGSVQIVIVALVGVVGNIIITKLRAIYGDQAAVKEQVVNHHKTNLREEADDRHKENYGMLRSIRLAQERQEGRQLELGESIDFLIELGTENRTRIIALEKTEYDNEHDSEASQPVASGNRRGRTAYEPPHPQGRFQLRRDRRRNGAGSDFGGGNA